MPKLNDLVIRVQSDHDRNLVHSAHYPLMVTTAGVFKATIDEDIVSAVKEAAAEQPGGERVEIHHEHVRGGGARYVAEAKNKSWLVAVFNRYGQSQLDAEVTTEIRIFFEHNASASFWKRPDGSIAPNGQDEDEAGKWYGNGKRVGTFGPRLYEIGIGASLAKVKKTVPVSGKTLFQYNPVKEDEVGPQGQMLKRFCNMPWPHAYQGAEVTDMKSVPYTEENAAFFVQMLMALCQLTERFDNFFGSEDVASLIANSSNPMLPAPAPEFVDEDDDL